MKKIFTCLCLLAAAHATSAQFTFTDNFDSYTAGAYLGPQSPVWTTWSGADGGTEDVYVSNALAHSGANSVYYSSTAANGGPTDCVLPFGAQFSTGTFVLDFWMYVNSGKSAYFNFQQNTTIGQVWNADWNFNTDGTLDITNQYGLAFSTTYTQGAWSHIVVTAQLNNSEWNINIDGTDMGTFHNTSLGVAAIDIYPINGSQFYLDDVSVTHTPYTLTADNIAVNYISAPGGLAGTTVSVKALLRNMGTNTIANPYISLYHNGSLLGSQTFTGMNLASMDTQIVTLTNQVTYAASNDISVDAQVAAGTADDDNTNDDTLTYHYDAITPAPGKLVVAEEGTGTWCGWCPRGAIFMGQMSTTYAGYFQGIAVHNADPMLDTIYDAGLGITSFPTVKIDRLTGVDPSAMEADFITRIQVAPKAMIINGAQWNSTNDTLKVSLTTTFAQSITSGNYKVACVIIEDNVTGTGTSYAQHNYYAGGGQGQMGGYELLPNPVPAAQMVYDFVARAIAPSFGGLPNAYTFPVSIGDTKTHNFAFAIPNAWNKPNLKIVGLFIDPTGKIDNASSTDINLAINNGYINLAGVEPQQVINKMALYPNPTSGMTNVSLTLGEQTEVTLHIATIDGKRIASHNYGALQGTQNIEINTAGWANGIYLVEVQAGKTTQVMKLLVQ